MKKKTAFGLILGAAAAVTLPVFLAAPGRAGKAQKAPFLGWNFAHRGLHRADKSVPENSLEAFRLAEEAGYGVELDVQLSQDGQVVVFHDDTLDRVCSVHGRVDAFSFEELQRMPGVVAFLEAEEEVCRLLRSIDRSLCDSIDMALPD